MDARRVSSRPYKIAIVCFLAAFHPDCTRCCPNGFGSCQTYWAWEDCPPEGCNGSSSSGLTVDENEASARSQSITNVEIDPVGTIAFVNTQSGTFVVTAIHANDNVRVVRIDPTNMDEDPLIVRTVGRIALSHPSRTIADGHGHAILALRDRNELAMIDPLTSHVEHSHVCDDPHALARDESNDSILVACSSSQIVTLGAVDRVEIDRTSIEGEIVDLGVRGDSILVSQRSRVYESAGGLHEAIALDETQPVVDVASVGDATAIVVDGEARLRIGDSAFAHVGAPGLTRAVALADVSLDGVTRRVLALQTVSPRMLVFFTISAGTANVAALEPLE